MIQLTPGNAQDYHRSMKLIDPPPQRHNWADYCDGQWRLAEKGVDYLHPSKFTAAAKEWAKRHEATFTYRRDSSSGIAFMIRPGRGPFGTPAPAGYSPGRPDGIGTEGEPGPYETAQIQAQEARDRIIEQTQI